MIRSGITYSFKKELLQGVHDFDTDQFGMALYRSPANLSPATTAYQEAGEVVADGYDAGGVIVDCDIEAKTDGTVAVNFRDVEWVGEITARGALIFNVTKGFKSVAVLDFSMDTSSNNGVFRVRFPRNGHSYSLLTIA
jgi:hypothetical protein